jgi:hypothetical protein
MCAPAAFELAYRTAPRERYTATPQTDQGDTRANPDEPSRTIMMIQQLGAARSFGAESARHYPVSHARPF